MWTTEPHTCPIRFGLNFEHLFRVSLILNGCLVVLWHNQSGNVNPGLSFSGHCLLAFYIYKKMCQHFYKKMCQHFNIVIYHNNTTIIYKYSTTTYVLMLYFHMDILRENKRLSMIFPISFRKWHWHLSLIPICFRPTCSVIAISILLKKISKSRIIKHLLNKL